MTSPKRDEPRPTGGPEPADGNPATGANGPADSARQETPLNLPDALERIAALESEIEQREADRKAAEELYLRERAELENFKRRMQREKAESLRYASEGLVRELLPVVDNFERAVRAARESSPAVGSASAAEALIAGVEMILKQLLETLERAGVTRVPAGEQPFDPEVHEAVLQVESAAVPPGTVVEEHLPGYRLHDRLIRAAQVSVSKAPSEPQN